jgi:hypothetical protein
MHAAGFDLRANTVADCTDKAAQLEWLDPKLIWFVQGDTGDTERHVLCEMTVPPSSARHDHRRVRHKRGAVPRAAGLRHGPPRNPAPPAHPPARPGVGGGLLTAAPLRCSGGLSVTVRAPFHFIPFGACLLLQARPGRRGRPPAPAARPAGAARPPQVIPLPLLPLSYERERERRGEGEAREQGVR